MPNWSDPSEIYKDTVILQKVLLVLLGLHTWEIITQLPFDWRAVSHKREVYWPLFFYFCSKYSLWFGVISFSLVTNVKTKINCQALFTFGQLAICTAAGSASTLLMLRTIAVWNRAHFVTAPLIMALLGLWGLLFYDIASFRGSWSDVFGVCQTGARISVLMGAIIFMYAMLFDFIVLALTTIKLLKSSGRSSLWHLLFRQGIVYFLIAFTAYLLPTIFLFLDLNEIMDFMFIIPAIATSSIVSCRLFVSLTNFRQKNVYAYPAMPHPPTDPRPGGGCNTDDATQAHPSDAKDLIMKKRRMGSTLAEITFRSMAAGIDSMGGMDEFDATRTTTSSTSTIAVLDLRHEPDLGVANQNGQVVAHVQVMVHRDDGDDSLDIVDLEKAESLSHEDEQKKGPALDV